MYLLGSNLLERKISSLAINEELGELHFQRVQRQESN